MPRRRLAAPLAYALAALLAAVAPASGGDAPKEEASSVGVLGKRHNVDIGDGVTGLLLSVPTKVVGRKGGTVVCVVFFADDRGEYIQSVLPGYAGPDGSIRLLSSDRAVSEDAQSIDFGMGVPYGAFPRREPGKYQVEARARLVLRGAKGNVVLAQGSTRFFVEG